MSTLLDQVTKDIADAMRQRDQVSLGPLRMLKAALMNREVEKHRALDEIEAAVQETGAAGPKDMGKVMKAVQARLAGLSADGRAVSEAVKKRLAG